MSDKKSADYMAGYEAGALAVLRILKDTAREKCEPLRRVDVGDAYGVLGGAYNFVSSVQNHTESEVLSHLVSHHRERGLPPVAEPEAALAKPTSKPGGSSGR